MGDERTRIRVGAITLSRGGLLDRAFEEQGYTVLRGPDILWGGDIRRFRGPYGVFEGLIGGPPCQSGSTAGNIVGTQAVDLIPEYIRVWEELGRPWSVMECVTGHINHPAVPRDWHPARLRDWDCGGLTSRKRAFWTWPFMLLEPSPRPGEPSRSVMASTWKRGAGKYCEDKGFLQGNLPIEEYERLQGVPGHTAALVKAGAGRALAVHLLGNGVPLAMGRYVAREMMLAVARRGMDEYNASVDVEESERARRANKVPRGALAVKSDA